MKEIRDTLKLSEESVILLFNTEGDTDETAYREIVEGGKYPLPEK